MMMKIKYIWLISTLIATQGYLAIAAPEANEPVRPDYHENVVYQYADDLQYSSPENWVGALQQSTPSGTSVYVMPEHDQAVFLKYDPRKPQPVGRVANPIIEVQIHNLEGKTSFELLMHVMSKFPQNQWTIPPAVVKIKDHTFHFAEFKFTQIRSGVEVPLRRKFYVLSHDSVAFFFQLITTETEYLEDVKVFEESMRKIKFNNEISKNLGSVHQVEKSKT